MSTATAPVDRITDTPIRDMNADRELTLRELLSPKELEVVEYLSQGLRNRDIAFAMGITAPSAKQRVHMVYAKTGCESRVDLAIRFRREEGTLGTGTLAVLTGQTRGQVWHCVECQTPRQWGFGWPKDRAARPVLPCKRCQRATRHEFRPARGGSCAPCPSLTNSVKS